MVNFLPLDIRVVKFPQTDEAHNKEANKFLKDNNCNIFDVKQDKDYVYITYRASKNQLEKEEQEEQK